MKMLPVPAKYGEDFGTFLIFPKLFHVISSEISANRITVSTEWRSCLVLEILSL